ncbi:MAG: hypothetical protein ACLSDQ_13115 [Adlercreutzia equolifaciens]
MDQSMFEVNLRQRNDLDPQIGDTVTIVGSRARPRSPSIKWPKRWAPSSTGGHRLRLLPSAEVIR